MGTRDTEMVNASKTAVGIYCFIDTHELVTLLCHC